MLNPFPSLLLFSFFTPTLFRLVVGFCFLYTGWFLLRETRELLAITTVPFVGRMRGWMVGSAAAAATLVGLALLVGFATQWASLLGLLMLLKYLYGTRDYQHYLPFSPATYALLLLITLSLLITGAGALAFDLPL